MVRKLLILALFTSLCTCTAPAQYSILSLSSVLGNTSPPDENFMYLDLDLDYYDSEGVEPPLYEINTTEEYGDSEQRESVSNCEIFNGNEPSSQDIVCILDMMEMSLLFPPAHDDERKVNLGLVFNVPEGMCEKLTISPAWHWNKEVTPLYVKGKTLEGGDREGECVTQYSLRNPNGTYTETRPAACEEDLCCVEVPNGICPEESSEETEIDYGPCVGGLAKSGWEHFDEVGLPISLISTITRGNKIKLNFTSTLETVDGASSAPLANYLKALDKDIEGLESVDRDNDLPVFLKNPTTQRPLPYIHEPNPFYTFSCIDEAGEILHRISLMIREWNTEEEFLKHYDSGGEDEADPDVGGDEGENCDYEERIQDLFGRSSKCNDKLDLDDHAELECLISYPTPENPNNERVVPCHPGLEYRQQQQQP